MKNIFVISDTWFNRPIGENSNMSVEEYNDMVINAWNKVVNKTDEVYVLGGFGISDLYGIVVRLNGKIHFMNNFYCNDEITFMDSLMISIENSLDKKLGNRIIFEEKQIIALEDNDAILSYLPLSDWRGKETGTICFHGLNDISILSENNISCYAGIHKFKPINISIASDNLKRFGELI